MPEHHSIRSERVRGFQPPWHTVDIYRCCSGATIGVETRLRRNWHGPRPNGAIIGNCGHQLSLSQPVMSIVDRHNGRY